MRLLGREKVKKFQMKHAGSRKALERWVTHIENSTVKNFVELKRTFPSADAVGNTIVFDVGGNKVRVISVVRFGEQIVVVTHVLTHEEYDRNTW